jgi:predicted dehydrogenase
MFTLPPIAIPTDRSLGIGIIGAGGIVEHGHMPGYRKFDFRVVGIASRSETSARAAAEKWAIPAVFADWRALVDSPAVDIVDVSYPFDDERREIVEYAAARGKHILMEKPFAHSYENAERLVNIARDHNVLLAVNQNARWAPAYRAASAAIERGLIGKPFFITHHMQSNQDSQPWFQSKWYSKQPRFQLLEYAVHHLDLVRHWIGQPPRRVRATIGNKPGQHSRGEMIVSIQLTFPDGTLAVVTDNNASQPDLPVTSHFLIDGSEGQITGQAIPPVQFSIHSKQLGPQPLNPELPGAWFPDAFAGTMGELMLAIQQRREPTISGADNLHTMKMVFDAYADAEREQ